MAPATLVVVPRPRGRGIATRGWRWCLPARRVLTLQCLQQLLLEELLQVLLLFALLLRLQLRERLPAFEVHHLLAYEPVALHQELHLRLLDRRDTSIADQITD